MRLHPGAPAGTKDLLPLLLGVLLADGHQPLMLHSRSGLHTMTDQQGVQRSSHFASTQNRPKGPSYPRNSVQGQPSFCEDSIRGQLSPLPNPVSVPSIKDIHLKIIS